MGPPFGSTRDLFWFDLATDVFIIEFSLELFALNGSFFSIRDISGIFKYL